MKKNQLTVAFVQKSHYIAAFSNQEVRVMQKKPSNPKTLSTPDQLLNDYPYAKKLGWTTEQIEFLLHQKLVEGEINEQILIYNHSFEKLLEFVKTQ